METVFILHYREGNVVIELLFVCLSPQIVLSGAQKRVHSLMKTNCGRWLLGALPCVSVPCPQAAGGAFRCLASGVVSCSAQDRTGGEGGEFDLDLKLKAGCMVGRVWPMGIGTLPLRKPSSISWKYIYIYYYDYYYFLTF